MSGAGTQTQGMVLPLVLVQGPQHGLLRAHRLQPLDPGHGAAKFLQLVLIPLRVLLEGFHTLGHVVLSQGSLTAEVRDEACESPWES